jgi:PAS domain S-box-containing protein
MKGMATILVVDDDPLVREYLGVLLASEGHRLLKATQGAEALELARTERPELIISDVLMPSIDGYEFVRQLRREPPIAATPVIFHTSHYHHEEALALAQTCGVQHLLTKPARVEIILGTVHAALEGTRAPATPHLAEEFDRDHLRLLTNKLAEKVQELETVNHRLKTLLDLGRQAEWALEKNRHRLQAIVDNVQEAILLVDDHGRYVDANPAACKMLGYRRADLLGRTVWDATPRPQRESGKDLWFALMGAGQQGGEYPLRRPDGTLVEVEYLAVTNIEPGIHLGVLRDITHRKQAEQQLREYSERLQTLSHRLLEVQEAERRSLARELHDEIGQLLTGLQLALEISAREPAATFQEKLDRARAQVQELLTRVREMALDLRPTLLDDLGLRPTLLWYFQRVTERTGVRITFKQAEDPHPFPPELETAIYRIVQESLTNVIRHARVTEATVRLWGDPQTVHVQIEDQGAGFDPATALAAGVSSGLAGMRERATLLGGHLLIESVPGSGTSVTAAFPRRPASCLGEEDRLK